MKYFCIVFAIIVSASSLTPTNKVYHIRQRGTKLYLAYDLKFHCLKDQCYQQGWRTTSTVSFWGGVEYNYITTLDGKYVLEVKGDCDGTEMALGNASDKSGLPWHREIAILGNGTFLSACDDKERKPLVIYAENRTLKIGKFGMDYSGKQLVDFEVSD